MAAHPPNLCPLCQQPALVLNANGTTLACTACGATANFDDATRRVRYTHLPAAYSRFDEALRNQWLTRAAVFEAVATAPPPKTMRRWPWVAAVAACAGLGLMGLAYGFVNKLPASPPMREVNTGTATRLPAASTRQPELPTLPPPQARATQMLEQKPQQTDTARPLPDQTATPTLASTQPAPVAPTAITIAPPSPQTQTAPPPNAPTALPTINAQRAVANVSMVTALPTPTTVITLTTPIAPATLLTSTSTPVPVIATLAPTSVVAPPANTPTATQESLPAGSVASTPAATPTSEPTPLPTQVVPTETPSPTPAPTQTPVPTALYISNMVYVGSGSADEYIELTNPTDQVISVPIHTWRLRISVTAASTDWPLGVFLSAPFNIPAHQSCRLYTTKPAASAGEVSPCGFLTLGRADDAGDIYPDWPGATITLLDGDFRQVTVFRY